MQTVTRRRVLAAFPCVLLAGAIGCQPTSASTPPPRPLTYVAIGASDSVGVGSAAPETDSWPAVLQRRLPTGSRLVNLGVSGSLAREALSQQLPVAVDTDPDLVTVWLAVNDYAARVPLERYADEIRTLLSELRGRTRAALLLGNVPELGVLPVAARFDLRDIDRWNGLLDSLAQEHGATLVDLRPTWREVRDHREYISSDGFHPSSAGYRRLAEVFYTAAAPLLGLA